MTKYDFTAVCIVPTGIGASIGGFAGDASPYVNLLSRVCPVITNPNTVNGAVFSGVNENVLYTEGYGIDLLFREKIALRLSGHNKTGVIFDKAIPQKVLNVHLNTLNAVKSVYGLDITEHEITKNEVGVEFLTAESGISTGILKNPGTLLDSAEKLINKGAEAIAVICYFNTPENDDDYALKGGIDPVGGVEAVISHLLTDEFRVPVAHAPAFDESELVISDKIVNKRAAAEYITPTFLPCILKGLYNAPKLISIDKSIYSDIALHNIKALVMPYDCLGGLPVIAALEKDIPVIAVRENRSVLDVTAEALGIEHKITIADSYFEAAGFLLAMKNGIIFK